MSQTKRVHLNRDANKNLTVLAPSTYFAGNLRVTATKKSLFLLKIVTKRTRCRNARATFFVENQCDMTPEVQPAVAPSRVRRDCVKRRRCRRPLSPPFSGGTFTLSQICVHFLHFPVQEFCMIIHCPPPRPTKNEAIQ